MYVFAPALPVMAAALPENAVGCDLPLEQVMLVVVEVSPGTRNEQRLFVPVPVVTPAPPNSLLAAVLE